MYGCVHAEAHSSSEAGRVGSSLKIVVILLNCSTLIVDGTSGIQPNSRSMKRTSAVRLSRCDLRPDSDPSALPP